MKRITLTALAGVLLLAGTLAAQADVDGWTPVTKHARSAGDADMRAASDACEAQVGRNLNGVSTSPQFKRCMARHGWRYAYTRREPTWIDPDTGLRCHNAGIATVCSNF
jgi:hypothetical protein